MLTLSSTSMAQDVIEPQMSTGTIYGSLGRFFPIFCHDNMKEAINAINKCYQQIPANNDNIEECLIADIYVTHMAAHLNKIDISLKKQPQYDTNFINNLNQRLTTYLKTAPIYKQYNSETYKSYMDNSYLAFKIALVSWFEMEYIYDRSCPQTDFTP